MTSNNEGFDTNGFYDFLVEQIQEYQVGEITEFKQGAVSAILQVTEEFRRVIEEIDTEEMNTEEMNSKLLIMEENDQLSQLNDS